MKTKFRKNVSHQTANSFINVKAIENNILYSNDGYRFGYIFVKTNSEQLLAENEKDVFFSNLAKAMESEKSSWQIISIPRSVDVTLLINNLLELRRTTTHNAKLNLITEEIKSLGEMTRTGIKEPLIILKIHEKSLKKSDDAFIKRLRDIKLRLEKTDVTADILEDKDIVYICKIFADLGQYQALDEEISDEIPCAPHRMKLSKKNTAANNSLLSVITPVGGFNFKNNRTIVGGVTGRVFAVIGYPASTGYGWLSNISNCTEAITAITFDPVSSAELGDKLSQSIRQNLTEASTHKDARMRKNLIRQSEDAESMIDQIDRNGDIIGRASILTMPFTSDEDALDETCKRVVSLFQSQRIKLKSLGNLQKDGFKALSPYYTMPDTIEDISMRLMPLYTLIAGSPMAVNTFKDDNGCYFAQTGDDSIVAIDIWHRERDRTNSNMVILGKSGTGKSTAVKHIIETEFMKGTKILCIDPEKEYKDLCQNLGGSYLDAGGGKNKINPLQIRPAPIDDDDEKGETMYLSSDNAMALHFKTLETFLGLYIPGLSDIQKALLKKTLVELYASFGIDWDTDVGKLENNHFPTFSDLYCMLGEKEKTDSRFEDLHSLFFDIAEGSDSFIWNGQTNIDINNDFICFDTNRLGNAGDNIKRTQYFNILTLCWEIMSKDRKEKVLLICDEAYLMIDPNVPQALLFLRNVMKRCRKYYSALGIVSHSIIDFLDEKIRLYGQALLSMPTYKIFFGCDGKDQKDISDIYKLTEAEELIIQRGIQREAICMIGSRRLHVTFNIPDYKLIYMGDGGGK
ncbi:MAG: DUF87 domain-containing protein [Oscillospiraceae bacterium]